MTATSSPADERPTADTASRLPREERRLAILRDVLDVVIERGSAITSRELAEAAGVSEGTIFKVFGSKDELIAALVAQELSDVGVVEVITALRDRGASLAETVEGVMAAGVERFFLLFRLVNAVGNGPQSDDDSRFQTFQLMHDELVTSLEAFRDQLRISPADAAVLLRSLALTGAAPQDHWGLELDAHQLTQIFLYGTVGGVPDDN